MNTVIKVENISKQYRLGKVGTGTISHDLNRWWHTVRGKDDPYLKIGQENDRTVKAKSDYVWALRDIDFEVQQGEVLGIVGRNGAGKSTLLKILSRTTSPTMGTIKIKGRVASLLEVGTGFHPELTGRENVFLNGAILGMTRKEIKGKFDEIVDFSGVEAYIDTPVKRYSSGMHVRLAFAVAAHLESEILVVDEVLAVGDIEFQKKCLGKMGEVSKGEGRTVLFVSHNMAAVSILTTRGIYLKNGSVVKEGGTEEIVQYYFQDNSYTGESISSYTNKALTVSKPIELLYCNLELVKEEVIINIDYIVRRVVGSVVAIKITNSKETAIITLMDTDLNPDSFSKKPGNYKTYFKIPLAFLAPNIFKVTLSFSDMKSERFDYYPELLSFSINQSSDGIDLTNPREGIVMPMKGYIGNTMDFIT